MNNDKWKVWDIKPNYGKILYKRAIGELDEMESSKALCKVINGFYSQGMKVLDVGCGAGHYLRGLKKRIDPKIDYFGMDATEYYITLAKKVFSSKNQFLVGDIYDIKFDNNSFDIVICNNVLLHLPPPPTKAIEELIRVSKKYVVIRTVFGERNYVIKEVRSSNEEIKGLSIRERNLIDSQGKPLVYNYFNMYTEQYLRDILADINENIDIKIIRDNSWSSFDNKEVDGKTGTKVIGGKQVSGNLLLDWRFIVLIKN